MRQRVPDGQRTHARSHPLLAPVGDAGTSISAIGSECVTSVFLCRLPHSASAQFHGFCHQKHHRTLGSPVLWKDPGCFVEG